jgi:hypothetical protein
MQMMDTTHYIGTMTEFPPKISETYLVLSAIQPSGRVDTNSVCAKSTLLYTQ